MNPLLSLSDLSARVQAKIERSKDKEKVFDIIVLGVGSMGSAACYYLAKQGYTVLGIEQFDIPHEQGSHAGQSRIIRKAYFEHPDYVPLLEAAYKNWIDIENETGTQLYFKTGLLYFGEPDSALIQGLKLSAGKYNVPINSISTQEMQSSFASFILPEDYERYLEPDAGFVTPERAILTYAEQAIQLGASIHSHEKTMEWKKTGSTITVKTDQATYQCHKLVITTGAWAGKLISSLANQLTVTRQAIGWMKPKKQHLFDLGNFPCWTLSVRGKPGIYYGFPVLPPATFGGVLGLKIGHHAPGSITDPNLVDRQSAQEEEHDLIQTLQRFIPEGYESTAMMKTCLYTYTKDENFILDYVPDTDQQVVVAAGFSGHGFKFASAVGEIMADLATKGKTAQPIGFLSTARFHKKY